jgi:hypothetical protein
VAATPPPRNRKLAAMKFAHTIAIATFLAGCVAQVAWARTWRVELNGSGDFRDIQPAVEAASSGDTIRIGPGRFQQLHQIVAPAWTEETIVAVTKDNLTFIGAGAEQTILGMTSYYAPEGRFPKVICSVDSHVGAISGLTIENMKTGIYWWQGTLDVHDCVFRHFGAGIVCWIDGGSIRDCQFEISNDGKALTPELTNTLIVDSCSFLGYGQGFTSGASAHNINFSNCEFRDNRTAMVYDRWSTGTIENTTIVNSIFAGLMVTYNSQVNMVGVRINGGQYGLFVSGGSVVTGENVILEGTTGESLYTSSESHVTINNSHILPASGLGVGSHGYFGAPVLLDLSGNYWGTTSTDLIDSMITDGVDDPLVHCTVQYLPIANGPVPTESTSWGDLKALFR